MEMKKLDSLLQAIACKADFATSPKKSKHSFNIFSVLKIETKEVIICRLLRELLDPAGSHNMGHVALCWFVRDTLGVSDFSESEAKGSKVIAEDRIDNNRRVDIVIDAPKGVIPIEVKIWAGDEDAQLSDYYNYYEKGKKSLYTGKIYYLTPTGWEPSVKSRGRLEVGNEIGLLSFGEDIKKWLNRYAAVGCSEDAVYTCIKQFVEVIDIMAKENNEMKVLTECFCTGHSWDKEKASAALLLLKHEKAIHREILKEYLKNEVAFGDGISKEDCVATDLAVDSHALVRLVRDGKAIACICVDTNLYLFCKKKENEKTPKNWVDYENGQYRWRYICPKDSNKSTYALKNIVKLEKIEIDLKEVLGDITAEL